MQNKLLIDYHAQTGRYVMNEWMSMHLQSARYS